MRHESVPVHQKFVALGFAAKNRVVVEYQASSVLARLALKNQGCSQPADTSAHDNAIVNFAGVDCVGGKAIERAITNLVAGFEDGGRVSI